MEDAGKAAKIHNRSDDADEDVPPSKVAKTEGDAEAPASAEGKEDVEKDRQGEDKEKGDGSEDSDEGTRSKSRSPTGSNQQADNNAAAPTRRSLRPRRPTSVAKSISSASNGKDKTQEKDEKKGSGKSSENGANGHASSAGNATSQKRENGSTSGAAASAKAKKDLEEGSLKYTGFPLDLSSLTKTSKPIKLDSNSCVRVSIRREYLSSNNRQVRSRQLWGTKIYTEDSDLVAVLVHAGYVNLTLIDSVASEIHSLHVTLKVLPLQTLYASTNSNNIRSRSWNSFDPEETKCSYSVKACAGTLVNGEEVKMFSAPETFAIIPPTFVPAATERVVNTRSSASASSERKNRFKQEVTLQYNLCNEPWLKYVMASVADQGLQPSKWTSARLKNEVIYAESQTTRYELSIMSDPAGPATAPNGREQGEGRDLFRWAKCVSICPLSEMRKLGIPFPDQKIEALEENVEWEQFKWGPNGVHIHGTFYPLARIHFMQKQEAA